MHRTASPSLARFLRTWLAWGAAAVILLPFARENTAWIGYLPMWLVAMPACALWALHRFALPQWRPVVAMDGQPKRRRSGAQAMRRRERGTRVVRTLRAA